MAIKSAINPTVATPTRSASYKSFQNFITGGSDLGTSVVSNAANKIVNFQRGAAGVAPKVPDLGSIIQTLSTNILNNVEGKVDSINQNVSNVVNKYIQKVEKDYQSKMQSIDANGPSKILENFLSLYDKAIGYIQFFGNPKNVRNLRDNLNDLRNVFAETFEVARNIRKTIVRVVNQLSNLPTASAGGGGLNLDIDLPGSPLKKGGAPLRRGLRGGRGRALLGAGALGMGAGLVTSALAQPGGEVQPVATETGGGISQPLLDKFSAILDRFDAAIKSMSKKGTQQESKKQSSSAAKSTQEGPDPKGGGGAGGGAGGAGGPADFTGSANSEKAFNYFVSQGYTKEQSAAIVGNLMQENRALDPNVTNKIGHKGIAQWDPEIRYPGLTKFAKSKGLEPNTLEAQLQYVEEELRTGSGGLSKSTLQSAKNLEQATLLVRKQYLRPGESEANDANRLLFARQTLQKYGGNVTTGVAGKPGEKGTPGKPGVDGKPGQVSTVTAAPTQQQAAQQVAQQVSQPAVIQSEPQVNVAPLNMGQQGARGIQKPPATSAGRVSGESTVPFLPSANPDNFLTLYSKMVYNIVDG